MSGAPKRLHEEGAHPINSKRPHEDNVMVANFSGKLIQTIASDYRLPVDSSPDGRVVKHQRVDPREADKRSSSFPIHRIPSPANGPCLDHSSTSENRSDLPDIKDSRDAKVESRDTKAETRELHAETRVDPQSSNGENDSRHVTRGDSKEPKPDREPHVDKSEHKMEKDSGILANPHLNWKETKEPPRTSRYSESSGDGLDPWRATRHGTQTSITVEAGKDIPSADPHDPHEAVGENKLELKGEEKNRERERKRKDEKYKDWGDRDRYDAQNNTHLVSSSKEFVREDRDSEKWDKEKKDFQKEKDLKDKEKDNVKKAPSSFERDILGKEKKPMDTPVKMSEKEGTTSEPKKHRELDSWKSSDRESKDKKRDRDQDGNIGRHEKRSKGAYGKELDDGYTEGDAITEKEKDSVSYGAQQRRRMLRARGNSQISNQPQFRSRSRENGGSQEKSMSSIIYKVGECMQEISKSWKEYVAIQDGKKDSNLPSGPVLEIRIPAEHVTATNRQVRGGQLWGTDIYTDDSDLVAVLMHTGYCRPTATPPPAAIQELRATIRVLPPQDCYISTLRNNVRSRAWGAGISCSFCVEKCCIVKKGGGTIDLEPRLSHVSAVEPTLAPVSVERTMTTRSAASNASRQQRFIREVTIQYNLCNEPWMKYNINVVADKGLKKPQYTSARLKKGEVLYLETHVNRYELCFNGEKAICNGSASTSDLGQEKSQHHGSHLHSGGRNHDHNNMTDVYRWSHCKRPLPEKVMKSIGIPLPVDHLEVLEDNLDWEDVQWSQTGVWIAGKEYILARAHFLSPS